jgi:hypothetical protein
VAGPNTAREALLAELLGDAGVLLDRMEALKVELPEVADDIERKVRSAGESSAALVRTAGEQAASQVGDTLEAVQSAAREARAAAAMVTGSARRFALLALLTGVAGGGVAGAIAALALSGALFR